MIETSGISNANLQEEAKPLYIGWAQAEITPREPIEIIGMFHARVSEGILDPLMVTALAIRTDEDHVVFVGCDVAVISKDLQEAVQARLQEQSSGTGPDPHKVVLNASHTHTGPKVRTPSFLCGVSGNEVGVELEAMPAEEYIAFAADIIVRAIHEAWERLEAGGIAYGQGFAVVGRNRRWVDNEGRATMYGLRPEVSDRFRHIEGYEDHSLNLVATYDGQKNLTGLIVNLACPAQEEEHGMQISADWWHETRLELRRRFGEHVFILPQCSAAGDQSPHLLYEQQAHQRMLRLSGRTARQEIAYRIGAVVEEILPHIARDIQTAAIFRHSVDEFPLPMNPLTPEMVAEAERGKEEWRLKYEQEKQKLLDDPELYKKPRWYMDITKAYRRMGWYGNVARRYAFQQSHSTLPYSIHAIRLGEMAFVTLSGEYYLDFGIQIKVRSKAVQTFLVQLTGDALYIPSPRTVAGGGYGSVPMSFLFGAEAGQQIAEHAVAAIDSLWNV